MFKILGAKPPGGLPVDGTRLDEVQWPYQSDTYWIMRAKFEEACGEMTAAYHVYQEAMSTFVMASIFVHVDEMFTHVVYYLA
jgi:hypothetical protein